MTLSVGMEIILSLLALIVGVMLIINQRGTGINLPSLMVYGISLTFGAISVLISLVISNPQVTVALTIAINLITGLLSAFIFTYFLGYIIQSQRPSYLLLFGVAFFPVLLLTILTLPAISGIQISNLEIGEISRLNTPGWLVSAFSSGMLIASVILVVFTANSNKRPMQTWAIPAFTGAVVINIILIWLSYSKMTYAIPGYSIRLGGFILIGIVLLLINLKTPLTYIITREEIIDSINDGIIIISNEDKVLELNSAAEQLIGIPTTQAYGTSIDKFLTNWNSISSLKDAKEKEFRGSINLNKQWHLFNVRIIRLDGERGKVIVLRDTTTQKGSDETRQRAREEMFNLLRSFFKSANTSQSSNDFFRDVLFQIAYTFRAESGAIYLVDSLADSKKLKFSLMARHGELMEDKETLAALQEALVASKWILGNKEPLIISDAMQNPQFAKVSQQYRNHAIAIFPLAYAEQLIGVLILARTKLDGFNQDEMVRLGVATEELASFIYSDRKRKTDIALAERHRLAQDLHDSITQKLYGLVTLTEAVKLGLESGASIDKDGMVEKIGENARQALREMRLFLFELEPVNIERDGLVSTLQQRLASVEGRSGIQARMLADLDIHISPDKETEIYYIVEEALNNILKHANAKSVVVKLKQRKESIYLEIVDNGCGFDQEKVEYGGKGLGNIKERAKRINSKFNITSSPEHGTKITLVVPQ